MSANNTRLPSVAHLRESYLRLARLMQPAPPAPVYRYHRDAVILASADLLILHSVASEDLGVGRLIHFAIGVIVSKVYLEQLLTRGKIAFALSIKQLHSRIVDKIRMLDLRSLDAVGPDEITVRLTSDVEIVQSFATSFVFMTRGMAMAFVVTIYACFMSAWSALVVPTTIITLVVLIAATKSAVSVSAARIAKLKTALYGRIEQLIGAYKQIRGHAPRGDALAQEMIDVAREIGDERIKMRKALSASVLLQRFAVYGILGFVGLGLRLIYPVSDDTIAGIVLILTYVIYAVVATAANIPNLIDAGVALSRIEEFDALLPTPVHGVNGANDQAEGPVVPTSDALKSLELRGLSYEHRTRGRGGRRSQFRVGPVDLTLHPGEVLFITGDNGSGKSTLLNLLTGLYVPMQGAVYVNGEQVDPALGGYRAYFCYTPVTAPVFRRLYGMEDTDPSRVNALLSMMELSDSVSFSSGSFSTVRLSTGQRKRLAMVTALLRDRPIFIFDEWAADQDPRFVRVFYREIIPMLRRAGKLVIAVTHDDHYFSCADRVIQLHEGRVVR